MKKKKKESVVKYKSADNFNNPTLTLQVPQQQLWHIACMLVAKRAFQQSISDITGNSNLEILGFGLAQSQDFGIEKQFRILRSRILGLQSLDTTECSRKLQ